MPWEVHIERRGKTKLEERVDLTEADLRGLEASDPQLKFGPDEDMHGVNPKTGAKITIPGRGMVLWWSGYSDPQIPRIRFSFRSGRLSATRPDDEIITKMRDVAKRLGATLVDDDGKQV